MSVCYFFYLLMFSGPLGSSCTLAKIYNDVQNICHGFITGDFNAK